MDTLDFTPNDDYIRLIEISEKRKLDMGLVGIAYNKLSKMQLFEKYQYELHHIQPRYRFKNKCKSLLNDSSNIAVLTIREHLLAHYYLTLFEVKNFKYSALMAFIQLFSLSKIKPTLTVEEVESLIPAIEKARLDYFGSEAHLNGSRKAGKIAGEKRKQRFKDDPEFRKYMLDKLKRTDEQRKILSSNMVEKNKLLPPWRINKTTRGSALVYKPQLWENFDSIYVGLVKYKLSYKALARCLDIPYERISNIVRIIKTKKNLPTNFNDYEFYDSFAKDYEMTYHNFESKFIYYASKSIPWIANRLNEKPWYYFDLVFENSIKILESGAKLRMLDVHPFVKTSVSSPRLHREILRLYSNGITTMHEVPWLSDWLTMKSFYKTPPFILNKQTKIKEEVL